MFFLPYPPTKLLWSATEMRVNVSRLLVVLFLTGLSLSTVAAQEKQMEALPAQIEPDQAKWYAHYKKQANAPNPDEQLLNKDAEPKIKNGFVDMFNGTDLTGWTPKGGKCTFEVVDGVIVGTCVPKANSTYCARIGMTIKILFLLAK